MWQVNENRGMSAQGRMEEARGNTLLGLDTAESFKEPCP